MSATTSSAHGLTAHEFVDRLGALRPGGVRARIATQTMREEAARNRVVPMREVFALAKACAAMDPVEIERLLEHAVHEVRVGAVSIMDWQARAARTSEDRRRDLFELYLRRHDRIDNWDLVDRAAPWVVGRYLSDRSRRPLHKLARSASPWERRTSIVATWHYIRQGEVDETFAIAERLVQDPHHFVQTAVGSWVREAGKRAPRQLLQFLDAHAASMPRQMLRFAIDKLSRAQRDHYLSLAPAKSRSRLGG
jgi:3-methyladenine DNA glycosylase AlkD